MMRRTFGSTLALAAGLALAACGDDDGGPVGPRPAEIAGVYGICQLTFAPEGALVSVDVRQVAFETAAAGVELPALRVNATNRAVELAYTPKGDFVSARILGNYEVSGNRVTLVFGSAGATARGELLLPERLVLDFQESPRQMATSNTSTYTVPRASYARLTGQSETNLAPQIQGRLTARFREGGCT